jgi:nucleoside 2-deoxyribosyltransferase
MTVLIYIAGPFRAPTQWGIAENVRNAERVGLEVARAGAYPIIPHANTQHFNGEGSDQLWLSGTLELMRRCDAVVVIDGWERSTGTRAEMKEAYALGLPVFICEPVEDKRTLSQFVQDVAESVRKRWRVPPGAVADDLSGLAEDLATLSRKVYE